MVPAPKPVHASTLEKVYAPTPGPVYTALVLVHPAFHFHRPAPLQSCHCAGQQFSKYLPNPYHAKAL